MSLKFPASIPVANLIPNNALQGTSGALRVPDVPCNAGVRRTLRVRENAAAKP